MTVHFPDLALRFADETIIDRSGLHWLLTTQPSYDAKRRVYVLRATLQNGEQRFHGWFRIAEDVVQQLEADGDLRVLALRAIKKYLDRTTPTEGFAVELPPPAG